MTTSTNQPVGAGVTEIGDDQVPSLPPLPVTEEDFTEWAAANEVWAEWVDGEVEIMTGVDVAHGQLVSFAGRLIGGFVEDHDLGDVLGEPVLVQLPAQRRRRSPDLFFLGNAKRGQLRRRHVEGPPDLIVEVVSPESRHRDTVVKFAEYEAAGVPEYWLADRPMRSFEAYSLGSDGRYARLPNIDGAVSSAVLPGLFFRPEWVWQLRHPKVSPLLRDMSAERARLLSSLPPGSSDKPG